MTHVMAPCLNTIYAAQVTKVSVFNVMRAIDVRKPLFKGYTMKYSINQRLSLIIFAMLIPFIFVATIQASQPVWSSQIVFPEPQRIIAPLATTVDSERQRYYVVDTQLSQIVSFDSAGQQLSTFNANAMLKKPVAMCFARPGKMWVVDRATNELLYIDLDTKKVRQFTPKDGQGKPLFIDHIATDSQWQLYVSDRHSGKIFALDDNLNIVTTFTATDNGQLIDFKVTPSGLWALDGTNQCVFQFSLKGTLKRKILLTTQLDRPVSLALNDKNQIFILDRPQAKIVIFNSKGDLLYSFGQKGYRRGQLNYPNQILFDWQQRLCVVNQGNDRIEIFTQLSNKK